MTKRMLLLGMHRACLEYANHVREERKPHWTRHWEQAMKDARLMRQIIARV